MTGKPVYRNFWHEGNTLSHREITVLELCALGLGNAEIAAEFRRSEETIKSHMKHILDKLDARNRAHAVAIGFRLGVLTPARVTELQDAREPAAPMRGLS